MTFKKLYSNFSFLLYKISKSTCSTSQTAGLAQGSAWEIILSLGSTLRKKKIKWQINGDCSSYSHASFPNSSSYLLSCEHKWAAYTYAGTVL